MSRGRGWAALATLILFSALAAPGRAAPPLVTAVETSSITPLPEERVRAAIGELRGKPLAREAVRASLDRLWGLGLFSAIRVDEVPKPDGIVLRFVFTSRPLIRRIAWEGKPGLDLAEVAAVAALAVGEEASPERLARAERDILARYHENGYLAARAQVRADPVPGTGDRDVTVTLSGGEPAKIGAVRLLGDMGLPADTLRKVLDLREGKPYRESLVRDRVRAAEERLRQEGYFTARLTADKPDWQPGPNRVNLDVQVAAGPHFRVEFEGRRALSPAALRSRLTFETSGSADGVEQEASALQVETAYRERGYHWVVVKPRETREGDVRVIHFAIEEGPRVVVESVTFSGNQAVPSDTLARELETRRPGLFRRGLFRQDQLDHDVGVVLAQLRARGYAEATVGPAQVQFSEDRERARVVIPVTEGPRLTAGAVTVEGAHLFTPREIEAALPFKRGSPWESQYAADGQRAIERLYATRGYHGAVARFETGREGSVVPVTYTIEEGEPTRIGRVLVRGLLLAREDVVRRTLPFQSGDVLLPDKLLQGQRRLGDFAAFDGVSIDPLRPPPDPFADVEVTLRERKPWHLDFGIGYSNAEGGRAFVEAGHDDVFGTGASVSIRQRGSYGGEATRWSQRTDLLGRVPFVFGSPWWLDADLFQASSGQLGYDLTQIGLWLDGHRDIFVDQIKGLRVDLRYRVESVRYSHVDPNLLEEDVTPGRQLIASVTPMLTLDRRDEPLDPTRGSFHQISLETGTRYLGSDLEFVKGWLETRWFWKWPASTVVAVAGRLGLAEPYGGTDALAIQDRFYAGGATTIRGFREDRVGPLDAKRNPIGGNATAILNLEWRFPLWRWLGGAVFVDTGAVTPEISGLGFDAFKTGVGGGLRIKTPVGPIRFDVGYALSRIPNESRTQFYVTVGNPF
ncbi:MAG TPA: POTRA domain-containing protein [Methylomirabilota bacterium]